VTAEVRRDGTGDLDHRNERIYQVEAISSFNIGAHELTVRGESGQNSRRSPAEFVAIDPANPEQRISTLTTAGGEDQAMQLAADFLLPADSTLSFTGRYATDDFQSSPVVLIQEPGSSAVSENFVRDDESRELSAEYRRRLGPEGSLMLALVDAGSIDNSESSLTDGSVNRASINNRESGETAARVLVTQLPTRRLTVRTTATTAFNYFEGGFRAFENGSERVIDGSDTRVEEDRHSIGSSVEWNLSDRWTFRGTLGAESYRIETRDHSSGVQTDPTGGIAVAYRPQARTTLSFESQREIGQLSFGQFLASSNLSSEIVTAGAAALEPQQSWSHTASYDRRFGDVGVLRFELSRDIVDNPVRSVALSDSIIVSQNTSSQTVDRFRTSLEYPFARFGRDDLVLGLNVVLSDSDTIDPVTGERREVSGVNSRYWQFELRRDPGDSPLSWGLAISDRTNGDNFSVRQVRSTEESHEWETWVEWEPVEGLRLRTALNDPRNSTRISTFFGAIRQPGLEPSFVSSTFNDIDRSASFTVEWRRREHFEIRASLSTRPRVRTDEILAVYGATVGSLLSTEIAQTPRAYLRFRFYH
jgi:hypothetical protein